MITEDEPNEAQILCDLLKTGWFQVWTCEKDDRVEMMYAGLN
jgi:hypothetical protein